ncbi:MAG: FHA domain-containing protein [Thermoguttaceae bacterium]|nr:FHA domain-containing protein [Thermoguttaceae bacterium]
MTQAVQAVPSHSYVLVVYSKDGRELGRFPLREGVNQVGAQSPGEGIFPDVDLSRVDNQHIISRRHAVVRVTRHQVTIADCGSTNGTYVDGKRISTEEVAVNENSSISFANIHAKLVRG